MIQALLILLGIILGFTVNWAVGVVVIIASFPAGWLLVIIMSSIAEKRNR